MLAGHGRHHRDAPDVRAEGPGPPSRAKEPGRCRGHRAQGSLTDPRRSPELGYTGQVLPEAPRLCPPATALSRIAIQEIEVDGYRVEAGTRALVGTYAMHHNPTLWDDPLVFNPDRFSPQNSNGRDCWQHLPFGGDPRSCIGDHLASARSHPRHVREQHRHLLVLRRCARRRSLRPTLAAELGLYAVCRTPHKPSPPRSWHCLSPSHMPLEAQ
jgi:Cytochrome P450